MSAVFAFSSPGIIEVPEARADRSIRIRIHATAILARFRSGSVSFVNPGRDLPQIQSMAQLGSFNGKRLSPALLRVIDRLSADSTPRNPLIIMSLYRANSKAHAAGIAVDIRGFAGSLIDSRAADQGLPAVLEILHSLEPGQYSLGLPKPPNSDPIPLIPPPRVSIEWPYFPAPDPKLVYSRGRLVVVPAVRSGRMVQGRGGRLKAHVLRWANERSAPAADLGSPLLREAIAAAEKRGVRFRALFPDALDHMHLQVH